MTFIDTGTLVLETAAGAVSIEIELMTRSLRDVLRKSERNAGKSTAPAEEADVMCARAGRVVRRVYRAFPIWNTCLRRSLVLHRMLRKRGIAADFRIGIGKDGERLLGHAWVESDGNPILDNEVAARFRALPSIVAENHEAS
jgi:hypothetical protein